MRLIILFTYEEREPRTIELNSSHSKYQLISNELGERQLHIRKSFSYRCLVSPLSRYFPLFLRLRTRFKKKQQASRLSRFLPPHSPCLFFVVPLPRGLLAKENPRTDASFSPRDLSFSCFFPPSAGAESGRQVNAKVAVRCKSRAFPP